MFRVMDAFRPTPPRYYTDVIASQSDGERRKAHVATIFVRLIHVVIFVVRNRRIFPYTGLYVFFHCRAHQLIRAAWEYKTNAKHCVNRGWCYETWYVRRRRRRFISCFCRVNRFVFFPSGENRPDRGVPPLRAVPHGKRGEFRDDGFRAVKGLDRRTVCEDTAASAGYGRACRRTDRRTIEGPDEE